MDEEKQYISGMNKIIEMHTNYNSISFLILVVKRLKNISKHPLKKADICYNIWN